MPTLKVNFKTPKQAKEFVKNFGVVGLKSTVEEKGNIVIITSKDKKTHQFIKQMVSDLKADMKIESAITKMVNALVESKENVSNVDVVLLDGSSVTVTPDFADRFMITHDKMVLNDTVLSSTLLGLAVESKESFDRTSQFILKEQE